MSTLSGFQYVEPTHPIFISYRRSDASAQAAALRGVLAEHFGEPAVFKDTDSLEPGGVWRCDVQKAALTCRVMLVVIGKQWLTVTDPNTGLRRLDDPNDVLRKEVATALARGIRVVPVLVDGASLPRADDLPEDLRPLLEREAHWITLENLQQNIDKLMKTLERDVSPQVHVATGGNAVWASYAAPAAGAATIMFGVNPELRDVLIVALGLGTFLLLVVLLVWYDPFGWQGA